MSTLVGQTLVGDQQTLDLLKTSPGASYRMSKGAQGICPALFGEHPPPTQVNTLTPLSVMGTAIAETVLPTIHIHAILGSREVTIDPFRHLAEWPVKAKGKEEATIGIHIRDRTFSEIFTPVVVKYAKSLGLYGSLVLARQIIRENFPPSGALHADVKKDPEEGGYATICFTIRTAESVDRALELDNALKDALYDRIPSEHRLYLSFIYRFE